MLTRINVPFNFQTVASEEGRHLLESKVWNASRLPVMIRHDGYTMVEPTAAQIIEAIGGSTHSDVDACDVVVIGAGPAGSHRCRLCRIRRAPDGRAGRDDFRRRWRQAGR